MDNQQTTENSADTELIARFISGDVGAMDALTERYRQPLFSWLLGMTSTRSDAEDLFQDIWIKIIKNIERFHGGSFKAWIWRIARNTLIDFRRKKKADVSLDAVPGENSAPMVDLLTDREKTPVQRVEFEDMASRIKEIIHTFPDVQREVFLMRTQGDLSFREIAETLGIPLNTALGRMHDAMGKLKRALTSLEE